MTEQQQAAMRQALEALALTPDPELAFWYVEKLKEQAITALRQALEQQPAKRTADEPVASYKGPEELWLQLHGDCSDDELETPVDYTDDSVTWCWHPIHDSDVRYVRADLARPQPAAQWVGLTGMEVMELWKQVYEPGYQAHVMVNAVARAIEAKLREKNGGKA